MEVKGKHIFIIKGRQRESLVQRFSAFENNNRSVAERPGLEINKV